MIFLTLGAFTFPANKDTDMKNVAQLQAKFIAKDHRLAVDFIKFINDKSEELDHFALIKQDVTEVTVKTTTSDVNGLTILDFKLAKAVDDYAKANDVQIERTKGIFGDEKI